MSEQRSSNPPVVEGCVYSMKCVGTGAKGDGICKIKGYTIIVEGAKEGNLYKIKVTKVRDRFAFGEIDLEPEDTEEF